MSTLAACDSMFLLARADADEAAFSAFGSHDFFTCRVNGTRAMINDVFFGIKHESSTYSVMKNNKNEIIHLYSTRNY